LAVTPRPSPLEKNNRLLLSAGTTGTLLGIALSTGEQPAMGGVITVLGLALTIYGLHRFGRSGSDQPRAKQ
jgi:hypothetical protein